MTAEERSERVRARVQGRTPEVRQASARTASERRWGQLAYAANQLDADRVYAFLRNYISEKRYAPTLAEIARAADRPGKTVQRLLQILDRMGRIERHPWVRGITLITPTSDTAELISLEPSSQPVLLSAAAPVAVNRAVDWKRLAKVFKGVAISRLTASQIARYFRLRCVEAGKDMAEREANVLLGLRYPELFLERHKNLEKLTDFIDIPRARRGCKSCGAKFVKIRPNQRYCSARCRAREKRRRREATPHGKLLKSHHNKRYRERHQAQERERHRQWKVANRERLQAQRNREHTRRSLNSEWNQKLFRKVPPAIAALRIANGRGAD
ncbi:MAG: LexA family protein [Terriglobales bacterium]